MPQFKDAWIAHQRKRWMQPDARRWLRPDYARFLPPHERKAGFDPDQPRDELGQWTETGADEDSEDSQELGSGGGLIDEFGAARRNRADGHHYVPRKIFGDPSLSEDARGVFEAAKTGKLYNSRLNLFDHPHRTYNETVIELFETFKTRNGIVPQNMTTEQAKSFVQEVLKSHDPRIRNFNRHMMMRELLYRVRFGVRGNE